MTHPHLADVGIAPQDWEPDDACCYYHYCGNRAPTNGICDECLDEVRTRDRHAEYDDYADYLDENPFP